MKKINLPIGFSTYEQYAFPSIVNVNVLSGKCCCKCVHCPVGQTQDEDRNERFPYNEMDLSLFRKIVNELNGKNAVLRIHSVGEPLLWDKLSEAVIIARSIKSWLFTCGVTTDKMLLKDLYRNVSIIEVSVNSINKDDYVSTKGIDFFELVKDNIEFMSKSIREENLKTRLIVSRVQSSNKKKDEEFVSHWINSGLVDDAFIRTYHSYNNLLGNSITDAHKNTKEPCLVHWARFNINVNGEVAVCFNEFFKKNIENVNILGNINEQSIEQIWESEKLKSIRAAEITGEYEIPLENIVCKECRMCQPLHSKKQTSEYQIGKINR